MLFNSHPFILVFLPIVFGVYLLARTLGRRTGVILWLVTASMVFYGYWNPGHLWVLLASVVVNYGLAVSLARRAEVGRANRWILVLGVAANLVLLSHFKYTAFVAANLNAAFGLALPLEAVALPLAISFFTFQQIAFLVDTARGETKDLHFGRYCLFVTFFPQLIAGPIVNHKDVMPQFEQQGAFRPDPGTVALGVGLFVFGIAKKVLLADSVAPQSDAVFNAAAAGATIGFSDAWLGALAYTLQLYFDFSGYSDMAIGLALLFGVRLPLNFDSPYKATSIVDFWRRWHMTLSFFLRQYLYVTLGGSRRGPARRHINLMTTMLLGGLWHGAGWTFVVWGALHGAALVVCHLWRQVFPPERRRPSAIGTWSARLLTLLVVICGWVLFRAASLDVAGSLLAAMAGLNGFDLAPEHLLNGLSGIALLALLMAVALFAPNSQQWLGYHPKGKPQGRVWMHRLAGSPAHAAALAAVLVFVLTQLSALNVFLYFQF